MPHDGSFWATSVKALVVAPHQKEWSSATARFRSAWTAGLQVLAKLTWPSLSWPACCWATAGAAAVRPARTRAARDGSASRMVSTSMTVRLGVLEIEVNYVRAARQLGGPPG